MSGHSKWSTIKHKKAKEDAKRGKIFTKLIKEITVAVREGGGDITGNAKLRMIVEKAKAANMPQENVTRAIKKGMGELDGVTYETAMYEGYGPHGIAVIVETLSDNKKRTVAEVRHIFNKMGGNLGESGVVSWMFDHQGVIRFPAKGQSEDQLLEQLLEYDVEDIKVIDDIASVICAKEHLEELKKAIDSLGFQVEDVGIEWLAKNPTTLEDKSQEEKVYKFLEQLEDIDDVQNVYANLA